MTAVILSLAILAISVAAIFAGHSMLRSQQRAFDRKEQAWLKERAELLDRLMYLSDRPWREPEPVHSMIPDVEPEPTYWPESHLPAEVS